MRSSRFVTSVVGLFGLTTGLAGARLWWRVFRGPGDDNPVGMVGAVVALLAVVPLYGLVLFARREPLRRHPWWVVFAALAIAPLLLAVPILWATW